MARRITIGRNADKPEVRTVPDDQAREVEELPFTDPQVMWTSSEKADD